MPNYFKSRYNTSTRISGDVHANEVLEGKTFSSSDGVNLIGTMPNIGSVNRELLPGESFIIPEGYHNGSGIITGKENTEIFVPNTRNTSIDMGETNTYRYVNTSNIPNSNTGTYTANSRNASLDMGETNTYRYVNTNNVPNSNTSTYTFSSGNGDTVDLGVANTYRYVNASNVYNRGRSDDYGMLYSETGRIPNLLACLRIATDWFRFHSHFQFRIVSGSCYSKLTPGVSGSGSSGRPWQFDDDWNQNWNGYFVSHYNYHPGNHEYIGFTNPGVTFGSPYADYCYYNQGDTRLCVLYIGYDPTAT